MENNKITILTIDDEEVIRASFRNYLEDYDYNVIEAPNGQKGLEMVYQYAPDLVLLDLRMPEMDGLDVLAKLAKTSAHTPVIVISGAGVMEDVVKALKLGAWDYLFKPVQDISMLLHAINNTLERVRLKLLNEEYQQKLEVAYKQLKSDLQAGKDIQRKLLPEKNKTINNYTFNHKILPSTFLSGDFVDYFPIDDNHTGFYSADVSGHGVPSALVTVFLKSFIQKNLETYKMNNKSNILHPEKLITNLNEELLKENFDKHIAIFYGIINNENILTYCNAGQFPNPLLISHGNTKFIENKGTPAGMLSFVTYKQFQLEMPPESTIVILSDGVLEVLPDNHLQKHLDYLKSLNSLQKFNILIDSISLERDEFPDDITYLSIKRNI